MQSGFFAERAVLVNFKSVGVVLFVFIRIVIALFALGASESDFNPHDDTSDVLTPKKGA